MVQWVQFAIRPTFTLDIPYPRQEAISRFASTLQELNDETLYLSHGDYAEFHLEPHLHRLWSPHLSVYFLEDHAPNHSVLFGRFAPRPNVWTLVWIFYLLFFCSIFFAAIFGGSQWMIGQFPWGWAVVITTAILYAGLFLASKIGQALCHDQMELLRHRLDTVLAQANLAVPPAPASQETREAY